MGLTAEQGQALVDQILTLANNDVEEAAHMLVELSATMICAVIWDPEQRIASAEVFHRGMLHLIAQLPTKIEEDTP